MPTQNNTLKHINTWAQTAPDALIQSAEARYQNIIQNLAQRVAGQSGHPLVLLAGPSASGKTTTAHKLSQAIESINGGTAHRVSLDDFYFESKQLPRLPDNRPDIESVYALDLPLLHQTLRALLQTGQAQIPHFQFKTGTRSRWDLLQLGQHDTIVLEGLHALHPEVTQPLRAAQSPLTRVYCSVSSHIYDAEHRIVLSKRNLRLCRRILRDSQFRGTKAEDTLAMWPRVIAGEEQYLDPWKPFADVQINAIHLYEPCVFKNRLGSLLSAIPKNAKVFAESRRILHSLREFVEINENKVPKTSLLREFMG